MANNQESPTVDQLFKSSADQLVQDFEETRKSFPHYGISGQEAEQLLIKFLNKRLPRRFAACSGFVIDDDNQVSKQCDVLVYDAENSLVLRTGETNQILSSDSIASIIEVKSKLNKKELEDAVNKIAIVKKLRRNPISGIDQPVTFSDLILNSSYGVIFAFDSETTLETLATNLRDINHQLPQSQWTDIVVILKKGIINYSLQFPGNKSMMGQMMPPASEDFTPPPYYIHLAISEDRDYALNRFFGSLVAQLTFYRKKTSISLENLLRGSNADFRTIQAYWYDKNKDLKKVPQEQLGAGPDPICEFNAFVKGSHQIVSRYSQYKWANAFIYRIVPPSPDAVRLLGTILELSPTPRVNLHPSPDRIIAFTSVLAGDPPSRESIKKHVEKQTKGKIEIRW